ncbi:MAG: hypothetical protein AB1486_34770 [Planctomycetota bacterium]
MKQRSAPPLAAGMTSLAREAVTAGTEGQNVLDAGGESHSVFTAALLDGLGGLADGDADHVITFGELFNYVGKRVEHETASRQTPISAELEGHGGGSAAFFAPGEQPAMMSAAERLRRVQADKD